jgi:hypothetical protein
MQLLLDMHEAQNYKETHTIEYKTLPKVGYIVLLGKQPIAAGFLRRLEPCFGQLDTFVSNPHFGSSIRHAAINLIVDELLRTSKHLKLQGIISFTEDKGILSRAKQLGFHEINQQVIGLQMK